MGLSSMDAEQIDRHGICPQGANTLIEKGNILLNYLK